MSRDTIIRVGPEPEPFSAPATYYDGETAMPHPVTLAIDLPLKALVFEVAGRTLRWPLSEIRELPDTAGGDLVIFHRADDPLARLVMTDRSLVPHLPDRRRRAPVGNRKVIAAWAAGALASVALIIFVLVPLMADQLARFIPPEGERALGEVTLEQIRGALSEDFEPVAFCEAPEGRDALDTIRDRLALGTELPQELSVHVLDHEMVNAFALPGGFVVLFRGLLEEAGSAEEVAAVLAHEVGHVVSRDPTRHALRSAGSIGVLGLIFGDFAGGAAVLFLANQLIEAQYSQAAETGADAYAHEMLLNAGLSPAALGRMFDTFRDLDGEPPEIMAHFMSHPDLADRIAAAEAAVPGGYSPRPLLSQAEWRALRRICD
ncbi:M48 family metallopeptidase [Roseivivax sp.]